MSTNGSIRSQILDPSGERAATSTMEAPGGQSPYFGWMGADGFSTVRVDRIQAVFQSPQRSDQYILVLEYGVSMTINSQDGLRLLCRLGWKEKGTVTRVTQ